MALSADDIARYPEMQIFAKGQRIEYITLDGFLYWTKWVAVRGMVADWAIYGVFGPETEVDTWDWERIKDYGEKIHSKSIVQDILPVDESALSTYRP